ANATENPSRGRLTVVMMEGSQAASCTITNKRKPQVKVIKELLPSSDTGKFNLQINGKTEAPNVGDKGETGFVDVAVGSNPTVGETEGTGTSLSDYESSIEIGRAACRERKPGTGPAGAGKQKDGHAATRTI